MAGSIADDIGFGLDDAAADNAFRQLPHHQSADEVAGESGRIFRQFGAVERAVAGHAIAAWL
jgi:hypothetical protein